MKKQVKAQVEELAAEYRSSLEAAYSQDAVFRGELPAQIQVLVRDQTDAFKCGAVAALKSAGLA